MLRRFSCIRGFAVVLVLLSTVKPALAIGYWNVPGNVAQWWGYGWGAGHHACYVLGPVSHKGAFAHHHRRLPYAPQPAYGCYDGCSCNYDFRQPSQFMQDEYSQPPQFGTPAPAPSSAPQSPTLAPNELSIPEAAAPPGAVFPAPVER
jgi:hypothetical protein